MRIPSVQADQRPYCQKVHSFRDVGVAPGESCFYLSLSPLTLVLKQRDAVSWGCESDKRIPAETPKGDEETVRK